jgi:hypothetical protein
MQAFGGMVAVELDRDLTGTKRFPERTQLFTLAESLGGVASLIAHPATMTHASIPAETRRKIGISDSLVRLSTRIEDANDLIARSGTGAGWLNAGHLPAPFFGPHQCRRVFPCPRQDVAPDRRLPGIHSESEDVPGLGLQSSALRPNASCCEGWTGGEGMAICRHSPVQSARGCVAQLVEQLTLNQRVLGSIPGTPTTISQ